MTPEEIINRECVYENIGAKEIIAALHAAGYKIMAREPTEAMLVGLDPSDRQIWREMWDTAP